MKKIILTLAMMLVVSTISVAQISFSPYVAQTTGSAFDYVVSADVDADGDDDIVGATTFYFDTTNDYKLFVWINNNGVLSTPIKSSYDLNLNRTHAIAKGDLNADGAADITIACGDSVKIFTWNGVTLVQQYSVYTGASADGVSIGDVDDDGHADIAVSHWNSPWVSVLYGTGTINSFTKINYPYNNAGYDQILVEKLGNDTTNSVIYMRGQLMLNDIEIFKVDSNRSISQTASLNLSGLPFNTPHGIAVGDQDGSGYNILSVTWGGNMPNCGVTIFDSIYTNPISLSSATYEMPQPICFANLDCQSGQERIILHGGWQKTTVDTMMYNLPYASHYQPTGVTTGDFNNDGRIDIAIADYNNGLVVLYNTTLFINQNIVTIDTLPLSMVYYHDTTQQLITIDTFSTYIVKTTVFDTCLSSITTYHVFNDSVNIICMDTTLTSSNYIYNDTLLLGCGSIITTDTIFKTVGIEKQTLLNEIIVYPNPTTGKVFIDNLPSESFIILTDMLGKIITQTGTGQKMIDLTTQSNGVYFLKVFSSSGEYNTKIIKK